jgi:hypothetical protein
VLIERFIRASAPLRPAMAAALVERASDPYTMAQQLIATALNKEDFNELA